VIDYLKSGKVNEKIAKSPCGMLVAFTSSSNIASHHVLLKLGFKNTEIEGKEGRNSFTLRFAN
jgi:hypothetical protein